MSSLYDIRTRIVELAKQDELSDEESFELETLITQELNSKSINIIGFLRNAEETTNAIDNEIKRLTALKRKKFNMIFIFYLQPNTLKVA